LRYSHLPGLNASRGGDGGFLKMLFARRKAFFGDFAPFPAAGNRSPANFTAFPPHETVFREILSLSRRGKPFF